MGELSSKFSKSKNKLVSCCIRYIYQNDMTIFLNTIKFLKVYRH